MKEPGLEEMEKRLGQANSLKILELWIFQCLLVESSFIYDWIKVYVIKKLNQAIDQEKLKYSKLFSKIELSLAFNSR